ncbi:ACP S-malonyltransferase [Pendulispora rubella]|uniref:[acyl-carrier-protein] S-malonyltransferase n=1 Tax=Pendulispora rubella TaxID=2741070 RepID=A0ABZ2KVK8_9BACT
MTCYLFPGQGSQVKGMGGYLFDEYPQMTEQASDILGYSIKALCLEDSDKRLGQTKYTQPALYVVNAMAYQQKLKVTGRLPDFVAGHSLGEYNALQAAGALSFEQGLKLVERRGELMSQAPKGAMAAIVGPSPEAVAECLKSHHLDTIDIANMNSPRQTVVAGAFDDLKESQTAFEAIGATFIPLNTSGAFHSRYMAAAASEFEEYLETVKFSKLQLPVIANVSAKPHRQGQVARYLVKQITHPVRWVESMQYLLAQGETDFEELGVGDVLTKLVAAIRKGFVPTGSLKESSNESIETSAAARDAKPIAEAELRAAKEKKMADVRRRIEDWNGRHPVGTRVRVEGYGEFMKTRSPAMVLFGHRAAIYLQGYDGYFVLDEVRRVA